MSEIVKLKHQDHTVEIEVPSRAAFEALEPRAQRALIEKAVEAKRAELAAVVKRLDDAVTKAADAKAAIVAKCAADLNSTDLDRVEAQLIEMNHEGYAKAYGAHIAAVKAAGGSQYAAAEAAPFLAEAARLQAEIDADVEAYQAQHRILDSHAARVELEKLPGFMAKVHAQYAATVAAREAVYQTTSNVRYLREAELGKAARAEEAEIAKRRDAARTPAQKAWTEHIEAVAKAKGVSIAKAEGLALAGGDPKAEALYAVLDVEKRRNGVSA